MCCSQYCRKAPKAPSYAGSGPFAWAKSSLSVLSSLLVGYPNPHLVGQFHRRNEIPSNGVRHLPGLSGGCSSESLKMGVNTPSEKPVPATAEVVELRRRTTLPSMISISLWLHSFSGRSSMPETTDDSQPTMSTTPVEEHVLLMLVKPGEG